MSYGEVLGDKSAFVHDGDLTLRVLDFIVTISVGYILYCGSFNTLRTGLLNCLNARSRGLTFRHRASCI